MIRLFTTCVLLFALAFAMLAPGVSDAASGPDRVASANLGAQGNDIGLDSKPGKDKGKKPDDKPKPGKGNDNKPDDSSKPGKGKGRDKGIEPPKSETAAYTVDLSCSYDAAVDHSTCIATSSAPDDADPIDDLLLDDANVCAPVVGGAYLLTPAVDGSDIGGYGPLPDTSQIVLVFEGTVSVAASATYWLAIDGTWVPATGPGLACAERTVAPTATPDSAAASTGSLVVTLYSCAAMPEDGSEPDWFGDCHIMDSTVTPQLTSLATGSAPGEPGSETAAGQTTWNDLATGTYDLSFTDATWCHGESDNVDAESNLIVTAGEATSAWIFFCEAPGGGS